MADIPRTDCLIVGAGPAGLTAAMYLARFRRDVTLVDSGRSRARWIPVSRNTPGFPAGIRAGVVRLCAVCDGYETHGRRVAVYGPPQEVVGHARFLRALSSDVTVVVAGGRLDDDARAELAALGIACIEDCGGLVWDGR